VILRFIVDVTTTRPVHVVMVRLRGHQEIPSVEDMLPMVYSLRYMPQFNALHGTHCNHFHKEVIKTDVIAATKCKLVPEGFLWIG